MTSKNNDSVSKETSGYTFCDACNQTPMCGIKAVIKDGVILQAESWENFPNSPLCSKGFATLQRQYHPQRLGYPLKRTTPKDSLDPKWIRITWDDAYELIVAKLKEMRENYGPESVCFYCGDPKEMRLAVQRLAFTYGSPNYGTESSTCRRGSALAEMLLFGLLTQGNPPTPETKTCLIWSANLAWSKPYLISKLLDAKSRGVKYIIVDPRNTPSVNNLADIHLKLRPGSDCALALGMLHILIKRRLYDEKFVEKWTIGFNALRKYVQSFPPDKVEQITWVPADEIVDAAVLFASNKPSTYIGSSSATTHNTNAVQTQRAILSIIAITGVFDVPGGVHVPTYPLPLDPDKLDAFTKRDRILCVASKRADAQAFPLWAKMLPEIQMNLLPEYVKDGKIRAMLSWGANTMMWPQSHQYQEAIKNLEFSVAVDYFLRPWTHNYMDIVLPAATCYERTEPFAVFGRKLYARNPVVKPYRECKSDWTIIFELGVRLGYAETFWNGDTKKGLNFILKSIGVNLDDIKSPEGLFLPPPGPEKYRKYELGLLREDGKPGFPTLSGKVELYSNTLKEYGYDPLPVYKEYRKSYFYHTDLAEKYPLLLISGARAPMYTHSKWRELSWLRELKPEPEVNINPKDAEERGIKEGDPAIIENIHGKIKVKAHLTYLVPPRVVDMLHGWSNANINELVPREFDPISGYPPFRQGLICQVRRVNRTG